MKEYTKPSVEEVKLDIEDIIATSFGPEEGEGKI